MGEEFLLEMFLALGEETTSAALKELYLTIHFDSSGAPLAPKDIYLAFLEDTPRAKQSKFLDLFRELHGGPLTEANLDVLDDRADGPLWATGLPLSVAVHGVLEHPFDTDYFWFKAEKGLEYDITVQHQMSYESNNRKDLSAALHIPGRGRQFCCSTQVAAEKDLA